MGKKPRRFADRPRITVRALMWFVLMVALSNGLCMMIARGLHDSGLPIEQIHRQEMALFLILNAIALFVSLYIFYAPWWGGKSRGKWLKVYLTQSVPFFLLYIGAQLLIRGPGEAVLSASIFIAFIVCGPLLLALVLSVDVPRNLRFMRTRASHGPDVPDSEDRPRVDDGAP